MKFPIYKTELRDTEGGDNDKHFMEVRSDGEGFIVFQVDVKDGVPWNRTPCTSTKTLEQAVIFADKFP